MRQQLDKTQKKELEKRINKLLIRSVVVSPFFSTLLYCLDIKVSSTPLEQAPEVEAAVYPDGTVNFFPPAYDITEKDLLTTLIHEVSHPAFFAWQRQGNRKAIAQNSITGTKISIWNMAHDYAINQIIEDTYRNSPRAKYLLSPKDSKSFLYDTKYDGWTAEAIYDDLMKNIPKNPNPKLADMGKGSAANDSKYEQAKWESRVINAYNQAKRQGEKLSSKIEYHVEQLLSPKLCWTERLQRFVGQHGQPRDWSYRRPSRRSQSLGVLLPAINTDRKADIVFLADSSGSMHGRQVRALSELIGLCRELERSIRLIVCDTEITFDKENIDSIDEIDFPGGGGSDFRPAFEKLEKERFNGIVIAATDGMIRVPKTPPTSIQGCFWMIWNKDHDKDPTEGLWGETVIIKED